MIRISWVVANADGVSISIDDGGVYGRYREREGSARVPYPCDRDPHTYRLKTIGGVGEPATKERTVRFGFDCGEC